MRVLLLACLFVLLLAGCGSADKGPSTTVEAMHIRAALPGTDWQKTADTSSDDIADGKTHTVLWQTSDRSMFYRVSVDPSGTDHYTAGLDDATARDDSDGLWHGLNCTRSEAVAPGDTAYHSIEYQITAALQPYYISAGATNARWNKDGKDLVQDILDSVQIFPK